MLAVLRYESDDEISARAASERAEKYCRARRISSYFHPIQYQIFSGIMPCPFTSQLCYTFHVSGIACAKDE